MEHKWHGIIWWPWKNPEIRLCPRGRLLRYLCRNKCTWRTKGWLLIYLRWGHNNRTAFCKARSYKPCQENALRWKLWRTSTGWTCWYRRICCRQYRSKPHRRCCPWSESYPLFPFCRWYGQKRKIRYNGCCRKADFIRWIYIWAFCWWSHSPSRRTAEYRSCKHFWYRKYAWVWHPISYDSRGSCRCPYKPWGRCMHNSISLFYPARMHMESWYSWSCRSCRWKGA